MLKNTRNNPSSPLSRRTKTVTEGYKEKKGGILGQDKTKVRATSSSISTEPGKEYTAKSKKRFGRTVTTQRAGGQKVKSVTKQDGTTRTKRKESLLGRAEKTSYKNGGKIVAQGADKADVRAERKQERKEKSGVRAVKKEDRKRRNKGYRQLKKDIRTGKLNPYADNMLKG